MQAMPVSGGWEGSVVMGHEAHRQTLIERYRQSMLEIKERTLSVEPVVNGKDRLHRLGGNVTGVTVAASHEDATAIEGT
jgi:hypothetical protein